MKINPIFSRVRPQGENFVKSGVVAAAAAVTAFLVCPQAHAADGSWNVNTAGNWNDAGNWTPGIPGTTSGTTNTDIATFGNAITSNKNITVDANRNIGGITFSSTAAFAYNLITGSLLLSDGGVIQQTAGRGAGINDQVVVPITFQGDGGSATITSNATPTNTRLIINGASEGVSTVGKTTTVTLNGSNSFANTYLNTINDGSEGGKLAVVKDGTGEWRLTGANTFSGGVTLNAGRLGFATNASAFGTGTLAINGGTLLAANVNANTTYTNAITVGGEFFC